jgi:hypothetical protein
MAGCHATKPSMIFNPSSVGFADTFSRKGRRKASP